MNTTTDIAPTSRMDLADWMSPQLPGNTPCPPGSGPCVQEPDGAAEQQIRRSVWGLLASLYPTPRHVDRRREQRYPFPYLIRLWPTDETGTASQGAPVVVVGKQVSERGLGFYHPRPLENRRMIAVLDSGQGSPLAFLVDLSWCRFTSQGWYESGGRFLEMVAVPAA